MKLKYLYVFLPLSIVFYVLDLKIPCFFTSFLSIMPVSTSISRCTNVLSEKLGDKLGGMLNATTGNIPELLICLFALKSGMFELVKAGLIGSIIGNLLFVLGISIFLGGLKYREQVFNKNIARTNISLLFLAFTGIIIVSIYNHINSLSKNIFILSFGVSFILIFVYILGLIFSLITHRNLFVVHTEDAFQYQADSTIKNESKQKLYKPLLLLILFTSVVAMESSILVSSIEYLSPRFNLSQSFLGIIVVPIAGNASEYITAVVMALKNKVSLCIEIAVGSGMQIALFATPLIIIIGFIISKPIGLVYNFYQIASLIISLGLSFYVFQDGKTYWLEGAILMASYFIIALGYFFM